MKIELDIDSGDLTAVAHTLRALGHAGHPNAETAAILQRAGSMLLDAAAKAIDDRTITIPLNEAPLVITDSFTDVINAHGFLVVKHHAGEVKPLDAIEMKRLAREVGNNSAQALTSIDRGLEH